MSPDERPVDRDRPHAPSPARRAPAPLAYALGALALVLAVGAAATVALTRRGRTTAPRPDNHPPNAPKPPHADRTTIAPPANDFPADAAFPHVPRGREPSPAPRFCARALPFADARAVDPRGHVWALANGAVRDETDDTPPVALPHENPPCRTTRDALAFHHSGAAMAVYRGRIYLKAADVPRWTETPLCTDVAGDPWADHENGRGWTVVVRRLPGIQPMLMSTTEHEGAFSWAAYTPFETETSAAVVDPDGSNLRVVGRQVLLVDRVNSVAGTVGVVGEDPFELLTRTNAGIVLAHDVDARSRAVAVGSGLQARFRRARYARPEGATTHGVFLSDYGVLIAVTDRGVEWVGDENQPFVSVATWPSPLPGQPPDPDPGLHTSFGWLADGKPAIVTRSSLLSAHCPL